MTTVTVEISGGVVQAVYSDSANVRVVKVDWDAGESPGDLAICGSLLVQPDEQMPEETKTAIRGLSR